MAKTFGHHGLNEWFVYNSRRQQPTMLTENCHGQVHKKILQYTITIDYPIITYIKEISQVEIRHSHSLKLGFETYCTTYSATFACTKLKTFLQFCHIAIVIIRSKSPKSNYLYIKTALHTPVIQCARGWRQKQRNPPACAAFPQYASCNPSSSLISCHIPMADIRRRTD